VGKVISNHNIAVIGLFPISETSRIFLYLRIHKLRNLKVTRGVDPPQSNNSSSYQIIRL